MTKYEAAKYTNVWFVGFTMWTFNNLPCITSNSSQKHAVGGFNHFVLTLEPTAEYAI